MTLPPMTLQPCNPATLDFSSKKRWILSGLQDCRVAGMGGVVQFRYACDRRRNSYHSVTQGYLA